MKKHICAIIHSEPVVVQYGQNLPFLTSIILKVQDDGSSEFLYWKKYSENVKCV